MDTSPKEAIKRNCSTFGGNIRASLHYTDIGTQFLQSLDNRLIQ